MKLMEYASEESLELDVHAENEGDKTYIILKGLSRRATHIIVFKWKKGITSPKDIDITEWGEPVGIFDGFKLLHNNGGKTSIGGVAGEHFVAAAQRDKNDVYYCDKYTIVKVNAGEHTNVLYSVNRTRQTQECDKIAVSFFKPTTGSLIPYNEIFYIIDRNSKLKYPINEKILKNDTFEIFVLRDSHIGLICAEGSHIKVSEFK